MNPLSRQVVVCDADDRSDYCKSQKFMFYLRSVILIIILFYLGYNKYKTGKFF